MERYNTKTLVKGDFLNNDEVDTACATRLLSMCADYGKDGDEAYGCLIMAFKRLEIYV